MTSTSDTLAERRREIETRLAALSPAKRALLQRAAIPAACSGSPRETIPRRPEGTHAPLSFAQELVWLLQQADPGMHGYNVPRVVRLDGALDIGALQRALDAIVERHEVLRTTLRVVNGRPVQVVGPPAPVSLTRIDLSGLPNNVRETEAVSTVRELSRRPFDLARDPLLRVTLITMAPDDHVLLLESHHVASDGWSRNILFSELSTLYEAFAAGRPIELLPLPIQYGDYAAWERATLTGARLDHSLAYWRERLAGVPPTLALPTDRPRPVVPSFEGAMQTRRMSPELLARLRALSNGHGATLFMTLLAAFDVLLARYSGESDIVVRSPIANRTHDATEDVIGYFANVMVLRTRLDGDPTFLDVLSRVKEAALGAYDHQDLPYEKVVLELHRETDLARASLAQVLFSLQDGERKPLQFAGMTTRPFAAGRGATKTDLGLVVGEDASGLRATMEYRTALFDDATIERMLEHYEVLLHAIVEQPRIPISRLSILGEGERETLIERWNATDVAQSTPQLIHELFEAHARRTPDAVAIAGDDGSDLLTYGELDRRATVVARFLRERGVRAGALVGVCVDRSRELIVALLGILKAGGAYVPLDAGYPRARLAFMAQDAGYRVCLTQTTLRELLPHGTDVATFALDDDWAMMEADAQRAEREEHARVSPTDLAYVIYTSGSTGQPKGVMVEHRSVTNYLRWMATTYGVGADDAILQKAPMSFDASVWELFLPLVCGARLVLARQGGQQDAEYIMATLARAGVTLVQFVPSQVRMLLALPRLAESFATVRRVFLGGEALLDDLASELRRALPGVPLTNLYGPTETTVYSSAWDVPDGGEALTVAIGRPIANTRIYVVAPSGEPQPIGVPGELVIGGAGVARGYHGRAELTADRFVPDPFSTTTGARLYRTGDRARWRSDGTLVYLGRQDDQVKIRGVRIEPGEVESVLSQSPVLSACAVAVRTDARGEPCLAAFVVPVSGATVSAPELRAWCRERLPEAMLPAAFVALDALPMGDSGKVNRRALPALEANVLEPVSQYVPPRTTIDHELVHIWEALLHVQPIGIESDFFELGGHSLLAVQMLYEIERVRGRRLPLAALFTARTIAQIALLIERDVYEEGEPPCSVLQPAATHGTIAFVHGDVRGGGWYARQLATLVSPDWRMIVLPTLRPETPGVPESIEGMAALHLRELRVVQPNGPYRLAGFCIGGLIAFEMARQLRATGETVDRVILIDIGIPNARLRMLMPAVRLAEALAPSAERFERRAEYLRELRYYAARLRYVRRVPLAQKIRWLTTNIRRHLPDVIARDDENAAMTDSADVVLGTPEFEARPGSQLIQFRERAASAYVPGRYHGAVDLIWNIETMSPVSKDRTRGWERVARHVRSSAVETNHIGLITKDIAKLAAEMRVRLGIDDPAPDDTA